MLINSLGLKNFKCFEELDVKFAPITLLTGANSSGKSSLINAILAVLQTEQFPFYLSPNGNFINLGGFEEIVTRRDINKNISLDLNLQSRVLGNLHFKSVWSNDSNDLPTLHHLNVKNKRLALEIFIKAKKYFINMSLTEGTIYPVEVLVNERILKEEHTISNDGSLIFSEIEFNSIDNMAKGFLLPLLEIFRSANPGGIGISSYALGYHIFNHIGSFRLPPERTYYQRAKAQRKIDTDGSSYIDQIIEWEETDPQKLNELNKLMQQTGLFDKISSNKLKGGRFELTVQTTANASSASLTDVGFGISQFLPIIVADLQLSNNSCLAISQPEIHLHPKVQAQFGNYLTNQIKQTEKQYIIETHSEYLLNRIRLLLVTGELKSEDIRVLYFENDGIKSTVYDVEFATDGQIKGAPAGFFDTYGIDVMDIALNAH